MSLVLWFVLGAALLPLGLHAVADHHVHLRLLRLVRPATVVPVTAHDAWWHSLPRRYRALVQASLMAGGALFGLAYLVVPAVAEIFGATLVSVALAVLAVRRANRLSSS